MAERIGVSISVNGPVSPDDLAFTLYEIAAQLESEEEANG